MHVHHMVAMLSCYSSIRSGCMLIDSWTVMLKYLSANCMPLNKSSAAGGVHCSIALPCDSTAELLQRLPSLQVCLVHISQLSGQAGVSKAGAPTLHRGPCSIVGSAACHPPRWHESSWGCQCAWPNAAQGSKCAGLPGRKVQAGMGRGSASTLQRAKQVERLVMRCCAMQRRTGWHESGSGSRSAWDGLQDRHWLCCCFPFE